MDWSGKVLVVVFVAVEVIQLGLVWAFIQYRYRRSLGQTVKLAGQLAAGERPRSYYTAGPPIVEQLSRHLETLGSQLEQYERQQREEEFNLSVLLANMVEGVMVVDRRRVVRMVNDELLKLFNLKQSPLGRTVLESLRESRVEIIVRDTIQQGEPTQQEVMLESTSMGQPPRHFDISVVPIRTKLEEVGGAVAVFHDITRIKQLEEVRKEFVSNVSHELRTPLAIFRGYLETLADNPTLPEDEKQRILETMKRHSDRLNALVEDLLTLTRIEARRENNEFSSIRLDALFRQLVRDWAVRMNSGEVEIKVDVPADLPAIDADAMRIEQVMFNLLENAVAYANPPRRIMLSARQVKDKVEIRVADNGIGIPPRDLPHIFERFYRVDKDRSRSSGGTGLGLSIVKNIIQAHGGSVHAESEVGKGAIVVIRLPVRHEA